MLSVVLDIKVWPSRSLLAPRTRRPFEQRLSLGSKVVDCLLRGRHYTTVSRHWQGMMLQDRQSIEDLSSH